MWKVSHTETVDAPAELVWKRWTDVAKWPEQDKSIKSASLDGDFVVGSTITLHPKGSPSVKVKLAEIAPQSYFASHGKLPLAKLQFVHDLHTVGDATDFTQTVIISGPLAKLYANFMGKTMEENLTARMKAMAKLVEQDALASSTGK